MIEKEKKNLDKNLIQLRFSHFYEDLSTRFRLRLRTYDRQYNNIYNARLQEVRQRLEELTYKKWGMPVHPLSALNELKEVKCVIIGSLFKRQQLKPSILQEVGNEHQLLPLPVRTHFVSDADDLILEDETQRVCLSGVIDVHHVVTGCVVAIKGQLHQTGVFEVEDYCWPPIESVHLPSTPIDHDLYLILVSGIEVAINKNLLSLQLLLDWMTGFLGTNPEFVDTTKVVHAIFAGNCIRSKPQGKPKYGAIVDNTEDLVAVKELDYVFEQLVGYIDVDVMPGEFDPTTHTLPQQPFHRCMFPKAARFPTFRAVSNPYYCRVENRLVLGSAGQPIDDIKRYSNLSDSLEILEHTFNWAHMAPTAPDTLACYPFSQIDPFIIREQPNIYFAGNQPKFQTKLVHGKDYDVRLVCVPSFNKTHSFVLVNLKNLDCEVVNLNITDPILLS